MKSLPYYCFCPIGVLILLASLATFASQISAQEFQLDSDQSNLTAAAVEDSGPSFLRDGGVPGNIEQLRIMEEMFGHVAEMAAPATVNITLEEAQGSGVMVSRDGYVLTAAHVIGRPNKLATITFSDGSKANAITLGINRAHDAGMLKITDEGKWPFLEIGESETLNRGQWVMAVGHPGGLTDGRSLVYRAGRILSNNEVLITTDCTLVGGDSGGPLVDLDGYVVGIHSRIGSRLTENFHVPIDRYSIEWDEYVDGAIVDHDGAFLGISFKKETGKSMSNEVEYVTEREAAALAGMQKGDIIIKINETQIENANEFRKTLKNLNPTDLVKIRVKRGDKEIDLDVTLGYK